MTRVRRAAGLTPKIVALVDARLGGCRGSCSLAHPQRRVCVGPVVRGAAGRPGLRQRPFAALLASLGSEAVVPPKAKLEEKPSTATWRSTPSVPRREFRPPDQGVPPNRHSLRPDQIELRGHNPQGRRSARAGLNCQTHPRQFQILLWLGCQSVLSIRRSFQHRQRHLRPVSP